MREREREKKITTQEKPQQTNKNEPVSPLEEKKTHTHFDSRESSSSPSNLYL
jgi:hypothetical protein